jgi:hypothetical protein
MSRRGIVIEHEVAIILDFVNTFPVLQATKKAVDCKHLGVVEENASVDISPVAEGDETHGL